MKEINFKELTSGTWRDFEKLFGERGACEGCWCMYWRLPNREYKDNRGSSNKKLMHQLVKGGEEIGILMYFNDNPIGWCSVAPREKFIRLDNSRILKPVDNKNVWSIVCFFIDKKYRRKGYSVNLLQGLIENLKNDFDNVCRRMGSKSVDLPHINKGSGCDYKDRIDSEAADLIASFYKEEIEFFDYSF